MSRWQTRTTLGLVLLGLSPALGAQPQAHAGVAPATTEETEPRTTVVFEGIVVDQGGAPADGAMVVTSASGKAITDRAGSYRLEVGVPLDAQSVQITAIGRGSGNLVASTSVQLSPGSSLVRVGPLSLASGGPCQPSWLPTFGGEPGTNGVVLALAVFDDGGGPALFVGGEFTTAGGVLVNHIAKWDGSSWTALGSGTDDRVRALAVFDDGNGPGLFAGGDFTLAGGSAASRIAKWDGSSWTVPGSGLGAGGPSTPTVHALAVFDDGGGPALHVGGAFVAVGGISASNVAKWDGSSWSALGSGITPGAPITIPTVYSLHVFDDGSGPALHAGGLFRVAGGVSVNNIAKWDGSTWSALGAGVNGTVRSLAVFDDGGGSALFVGGEFTTAGGAAAARIAKWNGSSWSALGSGFGAVSPIFNPTVYSLFVFDDGSGPALYAGGSFALAGGVPAINVARWDGASWAPFGMILSAAFSTQSVFALTEFDDGGGPKLHAGGNLSPFGGALGNNIVAWDGSRWGALGHGRTGLNTDVLALTVDEEAGSVLYAGGHFTSVDGVPANRIAKWDGSAWTTLGTGLTGGFDPHVSAMALFDDGNGQALYAAGRFTTAGGVAANLIAKWDGATWSAVGSGLGTAQFVNALAVFDDGSGPALYAAGVFFGTGVQSVNNIARWDGASWTALGSGLRGEPNVNVYALKVFDDGSGPALYAGGVFTEAGNVTANGIAKWDGTGWSSLGSGFANTSLPPGTPPGSAFALAVFDDGSGPALYAGGAIAEAGGVPASEIARWDGAHWTSVGGGMNATGVVNALTVFNDRSGPALYAGGKFDTAGGVSASRIAKWDGASWTPLGSGTNGEVNVLAVFNDRTGPALYAGGRFTTAFDSGDSFLAKWGCPDTTPPVITCPASFVVDDRRSTPGGEVLTFTVTAFDEEDPTPSVVCVPPSGSLFPPGKTTVICTATDFSGNQSTCQFTITVRAKVREP